MHAFFLSQWFGNLVTMDWWNDIWLNEGFARYMEKVSLNTTYPDIPVVSVNYSVLRNTIPGTIFVLFLLFTLAVVLTLICRIFQDDYFLNVCFGAISRDCLNSSHPISNPAETPVQIMEMFDTVSYDKVSTAPRNVALSPKQVYTHYDSACLVVSAHVHLYSSLCFLGGAQWVAVFPGPPGWWE